MNKLMPLKVENLTYGFRDPLFQNVNFWVAPGEFVTVIAEEAAGKSALIDCLVGNLKPTGGKIEFWGCDNRGFYREQIQQKVGWVISKKESYAPWIRVREYLLATKNLFKIWNEELAQGLMVKLQLDLDKRMSDLTPTDASKIRLIKALAFEPKLLILDEISAGLPKDLRQSFLEIVLDESVTGNKAVLNICHASKDTIEISDRVLTLDRRGLTTTNEASL
jgi:ABC-type multidrug transport system ATPase subunit